jgi:uncharacterized protein YheU (UPF0270 family)
MMIVSEHLFQREATDIGLYENGIHSFLTKISRRTPSGICLFAWKRLEDRLDLAIDLNTAALFGTEAMIITTRRRRRRM